MLKSRFLRNFTNLEKYEFLQFCHRRKYKEGEYIYYQNDPGTGMYFIESGRVQLIVVNNLEDAKTGNITFDLDAPDTFGMLSIGYELRRMSSAKCLTDCTLNGFFKPDFETLKKRHPDIAVKFLENVSTIAMKQLKRTTQKLVDVTDTKTAFSLQFKTYYEEEIS
ncbi:MAG: cyclic nucleotide-binding domain-containing protein [Balneolaceae bacterium]